MVPLFWNYLQLMCLLLIDAVIDVIVRDLDIVFNILQNDLPYLAENLRDISLFDLWKPTTQAYE